jgi:low affinity Fe/Cu permease
MDQMFTRIASQNRDAAAIQAKLDELIRASLEREVGADAAQEAMERLISRL